MSTFIGWRRGDPLAKVKAEEQARQADFLQQQAAREAAAKQAREAQELATRQATLGPVFREAIVALQAALRHQEGVVAQASQAHELARAELVASNHRSTGGTAVAGPNDELVLTFMPEDRAALAQVELRGADLSAAWAQLYRLQERLGVCREGLRQLGLPEPEEAPSEVAG